MSNETILIIEDEDDLRRMLRLNLKKEGYDILEAANGEDGLETAIHEKPSLILLDIMLPGLDGYEVCKSLKKNKNTEKIPVIMVTARNDETDIVSGLELGADDYIVKPFKPKVLIARLRTALRRSRKGELSDSDAKLSVHDITIDKARHQVFINGEEVILSATEFAILVFLAENPGWVFSRNQIIDAVKGSNYPVTQRSVDVQVLGLRKKLKDSGRYIETVRGVGYRLKDS